MNMIFGNRDRMILDRNIRQKGQVAMTEARYQWMAPLAVNDHTLGSLLSDLATSAAGIILEAHPKCCSSCSSFAKCHS
jgi:hypothetical protein